LSRIKVDRTRVKPVVKVTGEFWAQTTESDGNYNMFAFLEREGAQVAVEPLGGWVTYLLYQARARLQYRGELDVPHEKPHWWEARKYLANRLHLRKRRGLLDVSQSFYRRQYRRVAASLGGLAHDLVPHDELARLAHPYYNSLARGGEGHLEVAKNIYYTVNNLSHMVLSLKPFGCMPSSQSDGVQSTVMNRYKEMIFLPIETSGEGEVHALNRVQMALGEAKIKARMEFQQALESTGRTLEDIKAYVSEHPELEDPFYPVPTRPGIAGVAANFVMHVADRMNGDGRSPGRKGRP
jgi:predicted nucleotide-binding protein (sugar kinase/HSP70/actin superfamily)